MLKPADNDPCPCGGAYRFGNCCGPVLAGRPATTAEALMRSRYTAHVLRDAHHLAQSRCPVAPAVAELDADTNDGLDPDIRWLDLRILRTERGGPGDDDGVVEFIARYKRGGRAGRLHEVSRFLRSGDGWCYLNGEPGEPAPRAASRGRRR